mmetsp:Transcript_2667/g.10566  ORF Transcript_2667/g.10566 Transcript_2667/m.10566 type:complete len:326 (+) Transcript_2667:2793-3770(+)
MRAVPDWDVFKRAQRHGCKPVRAVPHRDVRGKRGHGFVLALPPRVVQRRHRDGQLHELPPRNGQPNVRRQRDGRVRAVRDRDGGSGRGHRCLCAVRRGVLRRGGRPDGVRAVSRRLVPPVHGIELGGELPALSDVAARHVRRDAGRRGVRAVPGGHVLRRGGRRAVLADAQGHVPAGRGRQLQRRVAAVSEGHVRADGGHGGVPGLPHRFVRRKRGVRGVHAVRRRVFPARHPRGRPETVSPVRRGHALAPGRGLVHTLPPGLLRRPGGDGRVHGVPRRDGERRRRRVLLRRLRRVRQGVPQRIRRARAVFAVSARDVRQPDGHA